MATPTATATAVRTAASGDSSTKTTTPAAPVKWTTDLWTSVMLQEYNKILKGQGRKPVPITQGTIDNFERIMSAEVGGQMGGFLRDNNPLNVGGNVYSSHPLWTWLGNGVTMVHKTGWNTPTGEAFLTTFPNPLAGAKGTANYLAYVDKNYGSAFTTALQHNAPTSMFLGASPWGSGDGAGHAPLKESSSLTTRLADIVQAKTVIPAHLSTTQASKAHDMLNRLGAANVPTVTELEQMATNDVVKLVQQATRAWQKRNGVIGTAPGKALVLAELGVTTTAPLEGANPELNFTPPNPVSWAASLAHVLGDLGSAAFWKRLGIGAAGVGLLVGGVVLFLATTGPAKSVESAAMKVVP